GMLGRRAPGRVGALPAALLVTAAPLQWQTAAYGAFPTVRSAMQLPAPNEVPFAQVAAREQVVAAPPGQPLSAVWRPPAGLPATGVVAEVPIPATASGFAARPAWLYLPPAYLARPRAQLPVLVLLS